MKDFSKWIIVDGDSTLEFFFQVLNPANRKQYYYVSVFDQAGPDICFTMKEGYDGSWRIIDALKLPNWIMKVEKDLQNAIVQNLSP